MKDFLTHRTDSRRNIMADRNTEHSRRYDAVFRVGCY